MLQNKIDTKNMNCMSEPKEQLLAENLKQDHYQNDLLCVIVL